MTCLVTAVSAAPFGPFFAAEPLLFSFDEHEGDDHDRDREDGPAREVDPLALLGAARRLTLRGDARPPVVVALGPAGFADGDNRRGICEGYGRLTAERNLRMG